MTELTTYTTGNVLNYKLCFWRELSLQNIINLGLSESQLTILITVFF